MNRMILREAAASMLLLPVFLLGTSVVGGCGVLDVSDPTRIENSDINNATGADLLRKDALVVLAVALGGGTLNSGTLADEFLWDPNPSSAFPLVEVALDRREGQRYEALVNAPTSDFAGWNAVRMAASVALERLRAYMPEQPGLTYIGHMFAVRGFATLRLAEDICPGFPLHQVRDYQLVYGAPLTTAEVFGRALADLDSAVVYTADSARFLDFARVSRGRALLGLGRFAEAATAVGLVPTGYVWNAEFSTSTGPRNPLVFTRPGGGDWRSVADREGGTGLDYVSAKDPRVKTDSLGPAYDGVTGIYRIGKYPNGSAPIVLASGIEARLIGAEAALRVNPNDPQWLTILNTLRTTCTDAATCPTPAPAGTGNVSGLPPLTDPGTATARVDLLFRERAFWLFATGHRLGDLRRLITHYGRTPDSVFPSGPYRLGGVYETGTSIPFPAALEAARNPAVTGCTSR